MKSSLVNAFTFVTIPLIFINRDLSLVKKVMDFPISALDFDQLTNWSST